MKIFIISLFFDAFLSLKPVAYAFKGIQVCVAYLILSAGVKMLKKLNKNILSIILLSGTFICFTIFSLFAIKFSSIFYILIGASVSVLVCSILHFKKKGDKGGKE